MTKLDNVFCSENFSENIWSLGNNPCYHFIALLSSFVIEFAQSFDRKYI